MDHSRAFTLRPWKKEKEEEDRWDARWKGYYSYCCWGERERGRGGDLTVELKVKGYKGYSVGVIYGFSRPKD